MLPKNEIKAQISLAYIHAVAANIGCAFDQKSTDYDSLDVFLSYSSKLVEDSVYETTDLFIQVKCTSGISIVEGRDYFPFSLPIKNYIDLRKPCMVPRILVVLCLPSEENNWITHTHNELTIKRCAYWKSLSDEPAITNTDSRVVHIPTANVFSPATLRELLVRISKQEDL